ncbi:MBL fold metallo-hydrolase RNA specificity domain-containing protein [Clostridium thermarum]|uniref:MBL fold metallo-hydrolase RNA specificity domain-containing protein n=1 Tax=Clostridium thermarum TaxID=1716543 RepID=UPI0011249DEF|nr:MBL fold metallo-hydrolase [Clostridium thermarum]
MKIEFMGAAECVTGSCHLINVLGRKILLDCGLYVGSDEEEGINEIFSFDAEEIDYVILSHAHIDHSGRIPLLYKRGYKGKVYCTKATKELSGIMLRDSGNIAEMEVEWKNRKRMRVGQDPIEPLYTAKDAEECMVNFEGFDYDENIQLFEGLRIVFKDSGHILGAAIVELFIKEDDKTEIKLIYSGDIGNLNIPIIKDPTYIEHADYVIMESTYGNRIHQDVRNEMDHLVSIVKDTFKRGGNVIIPSFAVGRTQEVLYAFNNFIENKILTGVTVYVDSPLALESTRIFQRFTDIYDEEAKTLVKKGDDPLHFEGLIFTRSSEESTKINSVKNGAVIIASSGMCEAGRIKHHLKHNLWRKECSIVFVGYQAPGTIGRAILDGAKKVTLFGEEVAVNAKVYYLHGLSGHADKNGLLKWLGAFRKKPKEIILVHGDKEVLKNFQQDLRDQGYNASVVKLGEKRYINIDNKVSYTLDKLKNDLISYINSIDDDYISKDEVLRNIDKILNKMK